MKRSAWMAASLAAVGMAGATPDGPMQPVLPNSAATSGKGAAIQSVGSPESILVSPGYRVDQMLPRPNVETIYLNEPWYGIPDLTRAGPEWGGGMLAAWVESDTVILARVTAPFEYELLATHPALGATIATLDRDLSGVMFDGDVHIRVHWAHGPAHHVVLLRVSVDGVVTVDFDSTSTHWQPTLCITSGTPQWGPGVYYYDSDLTNGGGYSYRASDGSWVSLSSNLHWSGINDHDPMHIIPDESGLYGGGILMFDREATTMWSAIYKINTGPTVDPLTPVTTDGSRHWVNGAITTDSPFGPWLYAIDSQRQGIYCVKPDGSEVEFAMVDQLHPDPAGLREIEPDPDGKGLWIGTTTGVYRIRANEVVPGPTLRCADPIVNDASELTGARLVWSEPVSFAQADVEVNDANANALAGLATGSGGPITHVLLDAPSPTREITIFVHDQAIATASSLPIDGDEDGIAGGDAVITLTAPCQADCDGNGVLNLDDIDCFVVSFLSGCL